MADQKFVCDICYQTLAYKRGLLAHKREMHFGLSFNCPTCDRTFRRKANMLLHTKTHTAEKTKEISTSEPMLGTGPYVSAYHTNRNPRKRSGESLIGSSKKAHLDTPNRNQSLTESGHRVHDSEDDWSGDEDTNAELSRHLEWTESTDWSEWGDDFGEDELEHFSQMSALHANELNFRNEGSMTEADLPGILEVHQTYRENWHRIRAAFFREERAAGHTYNFRISEVSDLERYARQVFEDQSNVFMINVRPGVMLRNTETAEIRFHYADTTELFNQSSMVDSPAALEGFIRLLFEADLSEWWLRVDGPNTKWGVEMITNITFVVNRQWMNPLGNINSSRPIKLPDYILRSRTIHSMTRDSHGEHSDHLSFFRCLALHNSFRDGKGSRRGLERSAKAMFEKYAYRKGIQLQQFRGVKLGDLSELENIFRVNIHVYSLRPVDGADSAIAAYLVRRSAAPHPKENTLTLNLFGHHFSYVSKLEGYLKKYTCSKCDSYFPSPSKRERHMATCKGRRHPLVPTGACRQFQRCF